MSPTTIHQPAMEGQARQPAQVPNAPLSKKTVLLMAVAAGISVANIYYNQPLLKDIARSLHVTETAAGSVAMLTQIGYGLGLFFIIPLGDKVNKKSLVLLLLSLLVVALMLMATARSIILVWVISIVIGILSVSAQVLLPMAATLNKANRGHTVGILCSGILTGVLAARVVGGFIASWLNWRYVYGIAAGMVAIILLLLRRYLPSLTNSFTGSYSSLLASTLLQVKRFALLRRAAITGGLLFGVFCTYWTTLTFQLSGAPFYYHTGQIGLFGLVAIAGASAAPYFGRLADKGNSRRTMLLSIVFILTALLLVKLVPDITTAFIISLLLLDIGLRAIQTTNIASIYTLDEASHSRINTIYMTSYFLGGAIGTSAGLFCWKWGGWSAVTTQMLLFTLVALFVNLSSLKKITKKREVEKLIHSENSKERIKSRNNIPVSNSN